jgi:carbonic anhydrase
MDAERFEEAANSGVDLQSWLKGCHRVEDGVLESVRLIRNHPMMPEDVRVHGLTIDPVTGELNLIDDGGH